MLKIGHSVDYHNLIPVKNGRQKLGGILFESDYCIVAHSDGDIILHTVSEAIMGALGIGDLGQWFSDEDPKNKNMDSLEILNFCVRKCSEMNYTIINIDLSIVTDVISFKDKKEKIQQFLSGLLHTEINIKASRFEQNCATRIKCYCVCLLMNKYIINW